MTPTSRTRAALGALALGLALAGCGSSDGDAPLTTPATTPAATAAAPATTTATPATTVIEVTVAKKVVTPAPRTITVTKGQQIALTVTSDQPDEVHVHGIDVEKELEAGQPGTLTFTASQTGSFEVETHKSGLLLFKLDVTG